MKLFGKKNEQSNGQSNKQGNNEDNLNPFTKKGDNNSNNNNDNGNDSGNNQNQNNQNQQQNSAEKPKPFDMKEFYKSSGLYDGIDAKGLFAAIRDGNDDVGAAILARMMENPVSVALTQSNKLIDAKVATVKESVIEETRSSGEITMAIRQMNGKLPFTINDAVAPIARQVLEGFLGQGLSIDDAVDKTSEYYKEVAVESGKHFNMDIREMGDNDGFNNSRMRHQQNNQNDNNNSNSKDEDWIDTLTSGSQTQESLNEQSNSNDGNDGS